MKYIQVEFRRGGKRYAFTYDGDERIEEGVDRVEIETRDGPGTFLVLGVLDDPPDDVDPARLRPIKCVVPRVPA